MARLVARPTSAGRLRSGFGPTWPFSKARLTVLPCDGAYNHSSRNAPMAWLKAKVSK